MTKKTTYKRKRLEPLQTARQALQSVDHVLRRRDLAAIPLRKVIAIVLVCGFLYGIAMGAYAFVIGKRSLLEQFPQLLYSGIKVPLLICFTVMISLPSFFLSLIHI